MKKIVYFAFIIIFAFTLTACAKKEKKQEVENGPAKIKIGWMSPSNLMPPKEIFIKELEKNGLSAEIEILDEFSYSDFIKVREFDLVFLSEPGAGFLMKPGEDYKIVGRSFSIRTGIGVFKNSKIKSLLELRGKIIGGPASQFRTAVEALEKHDMLPSQDYYLIDVTSEKQREAVLETEKREEIISQFDAGVFHDPAMAWFEEKGLAKILYEDSTSFPILAKNDYIKNNSEAMVNFFQAFQAALKIFRTDIIEEKKVEIPYLDVDLQKKIIRKTLSYDSNYDEKNEKPIRFYFTKDEIDNLQKTIDIVFELPIKRSPINVMDYIDTSFAEKATERQINTEE